MVKEIAAIYLLLLHHPSIFSTRFLMSSGLAERIKISTSHQNSYYGRPVGRHFISWPVGNAIELPSVTIACEVHAGTTRRALLKLLRQRRCRNSIWSFNMADHMSASSYVAFSRFAHSYETKIEALQFS
jgi:hypothetical protein